MAFWNRDPKKKELKQLNKALFEAAASGDVAKARALVEKGADVNTRKFLTGFVPLHSAAYRGDRAMVEFLLEKGANKKLHGGSDRGATDAAGWARRGGYDSLADLIKNGPPPPPPPPVVKVDEVVFKRILNGRVVEEIYDFVDRERTTFIRKEEGGPVEAVTRDSFANLGNREKLREAFNLHVARGGKTEESALFPATLQKPRSSPGGQP